MIRRKEKNFMNFSGLDRRVIQNFSLQTTWRQIGTWAKMQDYYTDVLGHKYQFRNRMDQVILDHDQSIFSTLADSTSLIIDGIDDDENLIENPSLI